MDGQDATSALSIYERSAAARALEAIADALDDDRLTELGPRALFNVLGYVIGTARRCALDLRRGYRAGDLDSTTRALRDYMDALPEEPPESAHEGHGVDRIASGIYVAGRPET